MTMFDQAALGTLAAAYPEQPTLLRHQPAGHELLGLEALVGLAQRMRPSDVEYNRGDVPIGLDPAATPANGLSAVETMQRIAECGSWMVLKFIEQDEAYHDLLEEALRAIAPVVDPVTGAMLKQEGFIFVSSPGSVTPFHFDPEHNILLQIQGSKTMTIFPAGDETVAPGEVHETFHQGGHRNLPWDESFAPAGSAYALSPGDAIYVPVKAPHWVQNGPEVSISLSITWRSEWSFHEEAAHGMNHLLRRAGLAPAPPQRFPGRNVLKSAAYRTLGKVQRAVGARTP